MTPADAVSKGNADLDLVTKKVHTLSSLRYFNYGGGTVTSAVAAWEREMHSYVEMETVELKQVQMLIQKEEESVQQQVDKLVDRLLELLKDEARDYKGEQTLIFTKLCRQNKMCCHQIARPSWWDETNCY